MAAGKLLAKSLTRSAVSWLMPLTLSITVAGGSTLALAHGSAAQPHIAPALAVKGKLPPPPANVLDLRFGDFFRMPIGPAGLEPTEKLLSAHGRKVRLVGYVVREDEAREARMILAPLPVTLGDEDESLSDDLPATAVFVHLTGVGKHAPPYLVGLVQLVGTLDVGTIDEVDGRPSTVRLRLDAATSRRIFNAKPLVAERRR